MSGSSLARSTSIDHSTTPSEPSTRACGRTAASRAIDQDSSRTGFQMPLVAVLMPQSQPKLHADLRIASKGSGYGRWRTPSATLCSLA